jgi:hypothetical protein
MPLFVAYHGFYAASHQSQVNELAPQGYRPVSLSVSGDPSDARYAAVWVPRLVGRAWPVACRVPDEVRRAHGARLRSGAGERDRSSRPRQLYCAL